MSTALAAVQVAADSADVARSHLDRVTKAIGAGAGTQSVIDKFAPAAQAAALVSIAQSLVIIATTLAAQATKEEAD